MKPLPKSLRGSKRYVLGRIVPSNISADGKEIYYAIYDAIASLYGDYGAAKISMSVVFSEDDWVIIKCSRGFEDKLRTAVATVNRIGKKNCAIRCISTSGTIACLKRKIPKQYTYETTKDVNIGEIHYLVCPVSQEKVDLYKEGIKHQDTFYFTREDLEEL